MSFTDPIADMLTRIRNAVLAGHAQKGLPAFGIYGRDVQDLNDNSIPADVAEKILRFARAAQAVATMRGKSYLSMGSVSMGIAGSIVNPDFFQEYLGMRNESIDLTEIIRRMAEKIYDKEEYAIYREPVVLHHGGEVVVDMKDEIE